MTLFLRLLDVAVDEKADALLKSTRTADYRSIQVDLDSFAKVPGSPFAYWVSEGVRSCFTTLPAFQTSARAAAIGASTKDDGRFLRLAWETSSESSSTVPFAKGGQRSVYFADVFLSIRWADDGREAKAFVSDYRSAHGWSPHWKAELHNPQYYRRPGLTWPRRTQSGLGMRVMPAGCIFADKGPAAFVENDDPCDLLALLAITTSSAFRYLVDLQMAFGSYEVGVIQRTPVPKLGSTDKEVLAANARRAWSLKRTLDTINETSHAFLLPGTLRLRLGLFDPPAIEAELAEIQSAIDDLSFGVYELDGEDRAVIAAWAAETKGALSGNSEPDIGARDGSEESEEAEDADSADASTSLHSWAVGVAFGRFDTRLATGEHHALPEPEPFDPLPSRSPGMISEADGVQLPARPMFVDDSGHPLDLTAHVGGVLERIGFAPENPEILRRWLAQDFFPLHIKMYSKSRRKAPIYWQLATPSAIYSVWLYIHAFSRDTLYKVQEIAAAKLLHEERKLEFLRSDCGSNPKAAERKALAARETSVEELRTFLEEVKRVAPLWNPDLDDGVIINFAPLWRLVPHHKPWQKELKTIWNALCAGEYDWAHLAMHLWPERVVPKCATDRSLAIAHGLEDVFWEEAAEGRWKPRSTPALPVEELVRERTSSAVKMALKSLLEAPLALANGGRARSGRRRKQTGEAV
jgi:hypothetical protein